MQIENLSQARTKFASATGDKNQTQFQQLYGIPQPLDQVEIRNIVDSGLVNRLEQAGLVIVRDISAILPGHVLIMQESPVENANSFISAGFGFSSGKEGGESKYEELIRVGKELQQALFNDSDRSVIFFEHGSGEDAKSRLVFNACSANDDLPRVGNIEPHGHVVSTDRDANELFHSIQDIFYALAQGTGEYETVLNSETIIVDDISELAKYDIDTVSTPYYLIWVGRRDYQRCLFVTFDPNSENLTEGKEIPKIPQLLRKVMMHVLGLDVNHETYESAVANLREELRGNMQVWQRYLLG